MENKTSNFFNSLVENKKQKITAVIYILLLILNWTDINGHNSEGACISDGHDCYSLFTTSLIVTIIFLVVALMFRDKRKPV